MEYVITSPVYRPPHYVRIHYKYKVRCHRLSDELRLGLDQQPLPDDCSWVRACSKINIKITETDNKLNQKNLYENIASTYYNIVQLNAQLESTKQNLLVADTLLQVTENKYKQGIAKQQDINESRVNQLTIKENINQIAYLIKQHYLSLKILADIPSFLKAYSIVACHWQQSCRAIQIQNLQIDNIPMDFCTRILRQWAPPSLY